MKLIPDVLKPLLFSSFAIVAAIILSSAVSASPALANVTYQEWGSPGTAGAQKAGATNTLWKTIKSVTCTYNGANPASYGCAQKSSLRGRHGGKAFTLIFGPACNLHDESGQHARYDRGNVHASVTDGGLHCEWHDRSLAPFGAQFVCVNHSKATQFVTINWRCNRR